jgi:hypothetical protein
VVSNDDAPGEHAGQVTDSPSTLVAAAAAPHCLNCLAPWPFWPLSVSTPAPSPCRPSCEIQTLLTFWLKPLCASRSSLTCRIRKPALFLTAAAPHINQQELQHKTHMRSAKASS